tara:strand:+ start:618 stop:965 length:348 start_codon:yes stop_codon:yes gene_type:complete
MTLKKKRKSVNKKLWLSLWAELGAAPITEAFLSSDDTYVEGLCDIDGSVTVNPAHNTVDTVIHELLHRMYPERSERSVRRTTSMLRKTLSDNEVQLFYEEYKRRRKHGRPRKADV